MALGGARERRCRGSPVPAVVGGGRGGTGWAGAPGSAAVGANRAVDGWERWVPGVAMTRGKTTERSRRTPAGQGSVESGTRGPAPAGSRSS